MILFLFCDGIPSRLTQRWHLLYRGAHVIQRPALWRRRCTLGRYRRHLLSLLAGWRRGAEGRARDPRHRSHHAQTVQSQSLLSKQEHHCALKTRVRTFHWLCQRKGPAPSITMLPWTSGGGCCTHFLFSQLPDKDARLVKMSQRHNRLHMHTTLLSFGARQTEQAESRAHTPPAPHTHTHTHTHTP